MTEILYCGFCGKSQHDVEKLIAGPSVHICNQCVGLCSAILDASRDHDEATARYQIIDAIWDRLREARKGLDEAAKRVSQIADSLVGNIGEDHLAELDDRPFRRIGWVLDTSCEVIGFGEALRDLD